MSLNGWTAGGEHRRHTPGRSQLVLFVSPDCEVCESLLPAVRSAQGAERCWLDIVLASDGEAARQAEFVKDKGLTKFPYVMSEQLGAHFRRREVAVRGADRRGRKALGDRAREHARAFGEFIRGERTWRSQHSAVPGTTRFKTRLNRESDVDQFDRLAEKMLRGFASRTSDAASSASSGGFLAGAAALPLLPVARGAEAESGNPNDPNSGEPRRRSRATPRIRATARSAITGAIARSTDRSVPVTVAASQRVRPAPRCRPSPG